MSVIMPCRNRPRDEVLNSIPKDFRILLCFEKGVSKARNSGAKKAGGGLLVFHDSDVIASEEAWRVAVNLKRGEFAMKNEDGTNPNSRFVAVFYEDFASVGGFDEVFKYSAEDRDFWFRAYDSGLKWKPIRHRMIKHFEHPRRERHKPTGIRIAVDNLTLYLRHVRRPWLLFLDLKHRILNTQVLTLGVYLTALPLALFRAGRYSLFKSSHLTASAVAVTPQTKQ